MIEGDGLALSCQDQGGLGPWEGSDMAVSWLGLKKLRASSLTYEGEDEPACQERNWLEGEAGWKVTSLALSVCL